MVKTKKILALVISNVVIVGGILSVLAPQRRKQKAGTSPWKRRLMKKMR